jgi:hypothetical protein
MLAWCKYSKFFQEIFIHLHFASRLYRELGDKSDFS